MSDEEITYTTVRFHKSSSGLQSRRRPDETQGPREYAQGESSVPWLHTVIPLGILCFILLVTVAVLGTFIFQCRQEKHELQKNLTNINQTYSVMQNNRGLNEMLRNNTTECDDFKYQEEQISGRINLNREQNRFCRETKVDIDCKEHTGKRVEAQWFCCGIKCYYFIMDNKHWNGCKQTCEDCSLSLLKIHDYDELKFLKPRLTTNSYWIGLSYNKSKRKWQWVGGGPSKL
ncbi:killer cell lectin-like receptor 2 [Cricetulus griseus]|nr:killer cell lectin-like receptor 2 [Cricetulus griseus]XP_035317152.1 killer cell lectin-like receptor 2 [Cricetulus griseus]